MIASCVLFYSFLAGIDPRITQAVIQVESRGNPFAVGRLDDSGLMQIRHKFVPETQQQLFQGCTNVMRGVELLKQAREKCKHKSDLTWIICYNLGHKGAKKIKNPKKYPYYLKILDQLNEKEH
jgi:soluble lytic murein transglycosylase-like protein